MDPSAFVDLAGALPGAALGKPAGPDLDQWATGLPAPLRRLLSLADGMRLLDGHFRLLGCGDDGGFNLGNWNHPMTWKYAWNGRADRWYCFGMSSFGDQFAFPMDEDNWVTSEEVWRLGGWDLEAERVASGFDPFLDQLSNWARGEDEVTAVARERAGPLAPDELLTVTPPPQFGLSGMFDRLFRASASVVMTLNGDAAAEASRCAGQVVERFETHLDEAGRLRLRFVARP